jgi:hypothetical protein
VAHFRAEPGRNWWTSPGSLEVDLRLICFSTSESMLQNVSSKAKRTPRNVYLHYRSPTVHQRLCALKWTEAAGDQCLFASTDQKYIQRSYIHSSATKYKSVSEPTAKSISRISENSSPRHAAGHDRSAATCNDTIYALSTGSGRAGIAIVRISGPSCLDVSSPLPPTLLVLTSKGLQRPLSLQASHRTAVCRSTNTLRPTERVQHPRRQCDSPLFPRPQNSHRRGGLGTSHTRWPGHCESSSLRHTAMPFNTSDPLRRAGGVHAQGIPEQ